MWELKTVFSEPNPDWPDDGPETNSMFVATRAEAESWFVTRTRGASSNKRVCTMVDPNGYVIKTVVC